MRIFIALLFIATALPAQTWQTVGGETDVVTFNQATTYSFGALAGTTTSTKMLCSAVTRNCFKSFTAAAGVPVVFNSNFTDPAPGVTKIVQVLQTATAQTGTTTHNGVKTAWTVPASGTPPPVIVPPPVITPPSTTPTVIWTGNIPCSLMSDSTFTCIFPATATVAK